jgi:hypothetical protein
MLFAPAHAESPYRRPERGRPLRVAFVGEAVTFAAAVPRAAVGDLEPRLFDFRGHEVDRLLADLEAFVPHAVVVFRPERVAPGAFSDLPAPVLGVATEALPRADEEPHEGLEWNRAELIRADPANLDRLLVCDPLGFDAAAEHLPAWRSRPLPVDDRLFARPARSHRPPRAVFVGYSTTHVERFLLPAKHQFDIGHYAHGLHGDLLVEVLREADIAINVHPDPWMRVFEHRVLVHLAAGHLVLSEPLQPTFGLEPGIDYLEIDGPEALDLRLHQLRRNPEAYERLRIRGHDKVQQHRASRVWPSLIGDLFDDLAAFGEARAGRPSA